MSLAESEFTVLRATIASRGTARMVLLPVIMLAWAALAIVVILFGDPPVASLSAAGRAGRRLRGDSRAARRCRTNRPLPAGLLRGACRRARPGRPRPWPSASRCPAAASTRCSPSSSTRRAIVNMIPAARPPSRRPRNAHRGWTPCRLPRARDSRAAGGQRQRARDCARTRTRARPERRVRRPAGSSGSAPAKSQNLRSRSRAGASMCRPTD